MECKPLLFTEWLTGLRAVVGSNGAELFLSLLQAPWLPFDLARPEDRVLFLVWGAWTGVSAESHSASGFSYSRHLVTWQLGPKAAMALKEWLKSLVPQQAMTFLAKWTGPGDFCVFFPSF